MNTNELTEKWLGMAEPKQKKWFGSRGETYRNILEDRRAGVTSAMVIEAYIVSLETGRKQYFIAPTNRASATAKLPLMGFLGSDRLKAGLIEFVSPKSFYNARGFAGDYDVYIDSYLQISSVDLSALFGFFAIHKPVRTTLLASRSEDLKHRLIEQASKDYLIDNKNSLFVNIKPDLKINTAA